MARRSYAPERIINKLREVEILLSQESTVGEALTQKDFCFPQFLNDLLRSVASFRHFNPPFFGLYSNIETGPILGGQVKVDDTVRDDNIHGIVRNRQTLDLSKMKLDVAYPGS